MNKIVINSKKCTGCRLCESVCALYNEGENNVNRSRIRIVRDYPLGLSSPVLCYQCGKPPCVPICPEDAIAKDERDGVIKIDYDKCIMCGLCASECPFGAIVQLDDKVIKCELCGGDPQCVKYCETEAIVFMERYRAYEARRLQQGEKVLKGLRDSLGL
jgi:Fe-S-cluster-containing hydrogenase component 2